MIVVKVRFFACFRALFGASEILAELPEESRIGDLLDKLCDSSEKKSEIFSGRRRLSHVVVMINGRPIDPVRDADVPLAAGDSVAVFPFLGGG